jgi:hypothetical protein
VSQRFQPNASSANRENLLVAVVVLVVVPLLIWFRGERNPAVMLAWGLAAGVGAYAFYTFRNWRSGIREVTVDGQGLTLVDRRGTHSLRWGEVERADYRVRAGSRWVFHRPKPQRPFVLWLDAFSGEDAAHICALIHVSVEHFGRPNG